MSELCQKCLAEEDSFFTISLCPLLLESGSACESFPLRILQNAGKMICKRALDDLPANHGTIFAWSCTQMFFNSASLISAGVCCFNGLLVGPCTHHNTYIFSRLRILALPLSLDPED
jgi:hypothetical protein